MKRVLKVDAVELNNKGKVVAAKGRVVKVIELNAVVRNGMSALALNYADYLNRNHYLKCHELSWKFTEIKNFYCGG